jgi:HAD superfamily hydrolase (TIGR01509 family)
MGTGPIDLGGIRNIILDLGGVILELEVNRTIRAFHELGFPSLQSSDIILSRYPFFRDFEIGKLAPEEFIGKVIEVSGDHATHTEILEAWNAMILGFNTRSIELLLKLRQSYRLFLLSNTNAIHELSYNRLLNETQGIENLDRIFEKVYYSHRLGLRKPNPEIFKYVLKDSNLEPEESLYVDDTLEHVESARGLGIRAYHLVYPEHITDVL